MSVLGLASDKLVASTFPHEIMLVPNKVKVGQVREVLVEDDHQARTAHYASVWLYDVPGSGVLAQATLTGVADGRLQGRLEP